MHTGVRKQSPTIAYLSVFCYFRHFSSGLVAMPDVSQAMRKVSEVMGHSKVRCVYVYLLG